LARALDKAFLVITSKGEQKGHQVTTKAKRRGRPFKPPKPGKRAPLSLLVRAEIKALVDERAKASGRTQSQEAEAMIERCLTYDQMMESMRTNLAELEKGSVEAVLWRLGYAPIRQFIDGKVCKAWAEPGFPGIERSGFVP
jgi:hypothetical protein